ncbi:MAG: energy transducer TonB [Gemmatimonadetes bacterium]|nr:energy transducer TonB [Gemmatimonadota bacterium]
MPIKRVVLSAFESSRRWSWTALWQQGLGVGFAVIVIAGFLVGGYLEQRNRPGQTNDDVTFLAPLQHYVPPPAHERLQYVGIGGALPLSEGLDATPTEDGTSPVAVRTQGGLLADPSAVPSQESDAPRAMSEIEVDSAAALDPTAEGPQYPADLLQAGVQGVVYARFIVDSTGYADTLTLQVLDQAEPGFVSAVRAALPRMKYRPAVFAGKRVSQLVEQAFAFRIQPPASR